MKVLIKLMLFLVLATASHAAEITETEVVSFIQSWFGAQNTGSFSDYANMYSKKFVGIRRSGATTKKLVRDAWLKERNRMFRQKMLVSGGVLKIKVSGTTASVRFEQIWESYTYKDKGVKLVNLALENGKLKIIREELLSSKVTAGSKEEVLKSNKDTAGTMTGDDFQSKYTSILDKDCSKAPLRLLMKFADAESAYECPAIKGWRLFKVYDRDSERSWLNIANRFAVWSTAEQVRINPKYFFGYFPNIDYFPRVEWRLSKDKVPAALIFRVAVTDPNPTTIKVDSWLSRLYIISLKGNEPRFCGIATSNEEAREIADKASNCTELLIIENKL